MKRQRRVLALGLPLLILFACAEEPHDGAPIAEREPSRVETRTAELSVIPVTAEVTGSVEPWARVSPGTKILARIDAVAVRVGDRVREGQTLARLERRDLEAAVRQAEAAVSMAEADLANASSQYRRIVTLHERGSVTQKSLEDATAAERRATAALEQARANHAAAEVTLAYAEIRSPVAGWVTAKYVEAGDMTRPGAPMFTLEDLSRVKVIVEVPESDVVGLARGQAARVAIDVLERVWDARVDRVHPAGDPATRTYRIELVLDNPDGTIRSGMFARASIDRGSRDALLVPLTAIVRRGQLSGVFVVEADSVARIRWIRVGPRHRDAVEILSGLQPNETYVVDPPPGFTDGARVAGL